MTPQPNTRPARRNAQIAAVKGLIGCDANTALISAVFPEPFTERDTENIVIKNALTIRLEQLLRNVAALPDTGICAEVSQVMKEFPRRSTKRKGRK